MCGLAGIVRFDDAPIDADRAGRMLAFLRHRGPDGEGVRAQPRCTFIHTRLSIIDLFGGAQPMSVPARGGAGELTLIFNGEIYNHRALRKQLAALGHQFVSDHSDTEALLHGYREWGTELPKRLHGMFAMAIWDAAERSLFLCRDRMGKKPLYLRWSADKRELMFASLVSTLVAGLPAGQSPRVDGAALLAFLRFGYTFESSLIEGVAELPAAHWLRIGRDGQTEQRRYWQPPPISRSSTAIGAVSSTRELLEEAVAKRLEADVPLGCFLSGGIDSSLIAAMAQRQLKARGDEPLRTFSVAMPEVDYDEGPYSRLAAKHLGTRHTELSLEPDEQLLGDLERIVAVTGEPWADSSVLATYWLSRVTRRHVAVALSGDGGDELFGGYDRYRAMRILAKHAWWLRFLPSRVLSMARARSPLGRLRRLIEAAHQGAAPRQYASIVRLFSDAHLRLLGQGAGGGAWLPGSAAYTAMPPGDWPDEPDPVHAAMRWDLMHYLPFDLLRKVDRASMAVALEVRCPLLDTQVCDLAGHLPTSVLLPGGQAKGLLKQVAAGYLPPTIIDRPKRGFAVPIGLWFRGPLRDSLRQYIFEGGLTTLGIDRYTVESMLEDHLRGAADHTHRLFALLMLSMWASWLRRPVPPPVMSRPVESGRL